MEPFGSERKQFTWTEACLLLTAGYLLWKLLSLSEAEWDNLASLTAAVPAHALVQTILAGLLAAAAYFAAFLTGLSSGNRPAPRFGGPAELLTGFFLLSLNRCGRLAGLPADRGFAAVSALILAAGVIAAVAPAAALLRIQETSATGQKGQCLAAIGLTAVCGLLPVFFPGLLFAGLLLPLTAGLAWITVSRFRLEDALSERERKALLSGIRGTEEAGGNLRSMGGPAAPLSFRLQDGCEAEAGTLTSSENTAGKEKPVSKDAPEAETAGILLPPGSGPEDQKRTGAFPDGTETEEKEKTGTFSEPDRKKGREEKKRPGEKTGSEEKPGSGEKTGSEEKAGSREKPGPGEEQEPEEKSGLEEKAESEDRAAGKRTDGFLQVFLHDRKTHTVFRLDPETGEEIRLGEGAEPSLEALLPEGERVRVSAFLRQAGSRQLLTELWNPETAAYRETILAVPAGGPEEETERIIAADCTAATDRYRAREAQAEQRMLELERTIRRLEEEEHRAFLSVSELLNGIIGRKSSESRQQLQKVSACTRILLEGYRKRNPGQGLTEQAVAEISEAALFYDLGKIGIPDSILNKQARLTPEEYEQMKLHTVLGARLINRMPYGENYDGILKYALELALHHHERYDGKGYPDGLSGEQIPFFVQVVSLADSYAALTSDRVYRKGISHEEACRMIREGKCGAFSGEMCALLEETGAELAGVCIRFETGARQQKT